ncbi:hypothetical protein GCM10025795_05560 [Verticiella sediminum]
MRSGQRRPYATQLRERIAENSGHIAHEENGRYAMTVQPAEFDASMGATSMPFFADCREAQCPVWAARPAPLAGRPDPEVLGYGHTVPRALVEYTLARLCRHELHGYKSVVTLMM